jgi:hypothetical protein
MLNASSENRKGLPCGNPLETPQTARDFKPPTQRDAIIDHDQPPHKVDDGMFER